MRERENGNYAYCVALKRDSLKDNFDNFKEELDKDKEKFPCFFGENGWVYIQIDKKLFFDESQEENLKRRVIEIIEEVFLKNCKE